MSGMPSTADEVLTVLRMRWLVWVGGAVAVVCLMLALTSFEVGRAGESPVIQWGAPAFFVVFAGIWMAGIRRLRARIAAARELLARRPGA